MRGNYRTPVLAFIAAGLLGSLPAHAQWNSSGSRLPRSLRTTAPATTAPVASGQVHANDEDVYTPTDQHSSAYDPHLAAYRADGMPEAPLPPLMGETIPSPSDNPATLPATGGTLPSSDHCEACEQAAQAEGGCSTCGEGHCDTCEKGCGIPFGFGLGESCGCPLSCPDACPQWKLFDDCCWLQENCLTAGGWLDLGYTANGWGSDATWNGPVGYNDRADELEFNQAYLYLERATKSECDEWDFGGRVDFLYGTDARWIESKGLEQDSAGRERWVRDAQLYHLALVQLYGEIAKGDWKAKFGKFTAPFEYEVIDPSGNFFYSHSYGYLYSLPTTQTGILATKTVNENFNWSIGLSTGWDNFFDNDGRVDFIGSLNWTSCDKYTNLVFSLVSGDERNQYFNETNRTAYSLTWVQKINERLTNVLEHDLGVQADGSDYGRKNATWYSLADYLAYQLSCDWWLGGRFEWFQDTDGTRVAPIGDSQTADSFPGSNPASAGGFAGNFYECTVGLNYKPLDMPNLIVRPELRWDNYTGDGHPFDNNTKNSQFLFAIDAIFKF